ncbi:hypothetical protein GCM10009558_093570 [Virgisporangium aurantiacum]
MSTGASAHHRGPPGRSAKRRPGGPLAYTNPLTLSSHSNKSNPTTATHPHAHTERRHPAPTRSRRKTGNTAEPDGLYRSSEVSRVELWLDFDSDMLHQGALITVDLADGVRLATARQHSEDFADRDQHDIPAILSALGQVADQVCTLVTAYHAVDPTTLGRDGEAARTGDDRTGDDRTGDGTSRGHVHPRAGPRCGQLCGRRHSRRRRRRRRRTP